MCLVGGKNSPYLERAKVGAYQKINLRKNIIDLNRLFYFLPKATRRYFKNRFGIVSEADVDVVLDATGFGYGDQWSDIIMHQVAIEVMRMERLGKKYIFLPQSLGPFTREENSKYASQAFQNASLVFAREKPSYEHVKNLLPTSNNLFQAPDFTNLLVPAVLAEFAKFKNFVIVIPNSKMLSNKNKNIWWRENYVDTLITLIDEAVKAGEQVVILNHSGGDDVKLCNEIVTKLAAACEIVEPQNAIAVKALISQGKLIVSSRFHGCVSALSQGIPCMATGWSHKYQELFDEYDCADLLLPSGVNKLKLNALLEKSLNCEDSQHEYLQLAANKYKKQSTQMWGKVFDTIRI
jgi:colanic acid/amylovoran biosynthesis protein